MAALAAGVATSMAQSSNVYSLNVVGYVNVTLPSLNPSSVGGLSFIANPLDDDSPAMPIAPIATPGPDAPPAPIHNGKAYWIKVSARPDGSFTVTNQRNGFSKTYGAAPGS